MKAYKIILGFLLAFFLTIPGFSQNLLQGKSSEALEQQAAKTAEMWEQELAMSAKQTQLMEDKLIEFAMKKNEVIQSNIPKSEKEQMIIELQERQFSDMRDILSKPQFEKYVQQSEEAQRAIDRRSLSSNQKTKKN